MAHLMVACRSKWRSSADDARKRCLGSSLSAAVVSAARRFVPRSTSLTSHDQLPSPLLKLASDDTGQLPYMSSSSTASPGATLVIGSLERGTEYQALIARLEADQATAGSSAARLDRYLVDRIVDGGASQRTRA